LTDQSMPRFDGEFSNNLAWKVRSSLNDSIVFPKVMREQNALSRQDKEEFDSILAKADNLLKGPDDWTPTRKDFVDSSPKENKVHTLALTERDVHPHRPFAIYGGNLLAN